MASSPLSIEAVDVQGVIAWLEEQRKQDRAEIRRLEIEIERLGSIVREQVAQGEESRLSLESARSAIARLPLLEDAVRTARDQAATTLERVDTQAQANVQNLQTRAAEAERDRRVVAAVVQTQERTDDAVQRITARVQSLVEEHRREGVRLGDIPAMLQVLDQKMNALGHRTDQEAEASKRSQARLNAQADVLEELHTEATRVNQWRQLADVRWNRQVAEWQQALANWRQAAEEHARPTQHLIAQVSQARDDARAVLGATHELGRRIEEIDVASHRLDDVVGQLRDVLARLDQTVDGQRRRSDEQATAQLRLDEALGRLTELHHLLERSLADHDRQLSEEALVNRATTDELGRLRIELVDASSGAKRELSDVQADAIRRVDATRADLEQLASRLSDIDRMRRIHIDRLSEEFRRHSDEVADIRIAAGPG